MGLKVDGTIYALLHVLQWILVCANMLILILTAGTYTHCCTWTHTYSMLHGLGLDWLLDNCMVVLMSKQMPN